MTLGSADVGQVYANVPERSDTCMYASLPRNVRNVVAADIPVVLTQEAAGGVDMCVCVSIYVYVLYTSERDPGEVGGVG